MTPPGLATVPLIFGSSQRNPRSAKPWFDAESRLLIPFAGCVKKPPCVKHSRGGYVLAAVPGEAVEPDRGGATPV